MGGGGEKKRNGEGITEAEEIVIQIGWFYCSLGLFEVPKPSLQVTKHTNRFIMKQRAKEVALTCNPCFTDTVHVELPKPQDVRTTKSW